MTLIPTAAYKANREAYCYCDPDVEFTIVQTASLPYGDSFKGILASSVPSCPPGAINMRKLETICQSVFRDCSLAQKEFRWTKTHLDNLKQITCAIVHWKMASQGGRADLNVKNVLAKWDDRTHEKLLSAYEKKDLSMFRIGGIRIPTATALLRFLFPESFGVIDNRVVKNHTQPAGITSLSLRTDGYILDLAGNVNKYVSEYIPFLRKEAQALNDQKITFEDRDAAGNPITATFRPCDIEMALF